MSVNNSNVYRKLKSFARRSRVQSDCTPKSAPTSPTNFRKNTTLVVGRSSSLLLLPIMQSNNVTESPKTKRISSLKSYTHKETIEIKTNRYEKLPNKFHDLKKVKVLRLTRDIFTLGDGLTELPSTFGNMPTLEVLDLGGNHKLQVVNIPPFENLRELALENCCLTEIPTGLEKLRQLKKLNLDNNKIEFPKLDCLPNVEYLSLSNNGISKITENFPTHLRTLDISDNFLTLLPPLNTSELLKLYLRKNDLCYLPHSIVSCQKLKVLDVSKNALKKLPDRIGDLTNLVLLNVSYNALTSLPQSIGSLSCIDNRFLCGENPLQNPPMEVALQGLNSIKLYFKALKASSTCDSKRLKLMILGDSRTGKTSVAKSIVTCNEAEEMTESTIGIDFFKWKANPMTSPLEILIVDCAGQKKYLLTHQIFLSVGMLFMVVVDLSKYEEIESNFQEKVGYWIDLIISKVPTAVILIVPTHLDKFTDDAEVEHRCQHIIDCAQKYIKDRKEHIENREEYCKMGSQQKLDCLIEPVLPSSCLLEFANSVEQSKEGSRGNGSANDLKIYLIPVSNKNPLRGMKTLRDEIVHIANNQKFCPNVHRIVPQSWMNLEKLCIAECDQRTPPIIYLDEINEKAACFKERSDITEALKYLDSVGTIVYLHEFDTDVVFLNCNWLIDVLKLIFRHDHDTAMTYLDHYEIHEMFEKEFEQDKIFLTTSGLLSKKLLRCILSSKVKSDEIFNLIMKLLCQFELTYDVELSLASKQKCLLVPWYFVDQCPNTLRNWPLDEKKRIVTLMEIRGIMPDGFFQRFIIKVHSLNILKDCIPWNVGFVGVCDYGEIRCHHVKEKPHCGYIKLEGFVASEEIYHLWLVIVPILKTLKAFLEEWKGISHCLYSLCPSCCVDNIEVPSLWRLELDNLDSHDERCEGLLSCHREGREINKWLIFPHKGLLLKSITSGHMEKFTSIDLNDQLNVEEKDRIARLLGNRSENLRKALNVSEGLLGPLHAHVNYVERVIEIISLWEQREKAPSKDLFLKALVKMYPYPMQVADVVLATKEVSK